MDGEIKFERIDPQPIKRYRVWYFDGTIREFDSEDGFRDGKSGEIKAILKTEALSSSTFKFGGDLEAMADRVDRDRKIARGE